ncbi:hypothetical protein M2352_000327 [Azospirillum fermentarium]|uniref:hypothetical protein n=1 Tax=Azospirillum fermentarium TaxID=1233114 RepID=UPI0022260F63|nr:hypothetical protein [Azospirillum fermentarium]MCW2244736.1 hypothetical protein [Azospirillum fermentarium]
MTSANDQWGPFTPGIDPAERLARLRSLRSLASVLVHPNDAARLLSVLREAEANDNAAPQALDLINHLPALSRRRLLASYAAVHTPTPRK